MRTDRENVKCLRVESMLVPLAPTKAVLGLNPDLSGEKPAKKKGLSLSL
jgi:hypothetical protein